MSAHYILHICLPDSDEQLVQIEDKLIFGSDESCDVCFPEDGIDAQHLTFRVNNGVLTVKNHSANEPMLGKSPLKRRKMIIIDQGDIISINDLQLKISKEIDEDDAILDEVVHEEELPTATTLFKLAKAELEENGEQSFTDVISTDGLSTEDKTGEFDLSESVEEESEDDFVADAPKEKSKSKFSFSSLFKKKSSTNRPEENITETPAKRQVVTTEVNSKIIAAAKLSSNDKDEDEEVDFPKQKPLGFLSRLYLLFASYSIAYTLYNLFEEQITAYLHHPLLLEQLNQPFVTDLLKLITPYWEMLPANISAYIIKLYPLFILVTLQDIVFSILLGFPLPLFLVGATQKGNFLIRRITSLMRSILGVFHPLVIFDLPLLFSKPTLKEILTVTTVYGQTIKVKAFFGYFIMIPIVLALCTSAPILFSPHFSSTGVNKFKNQTIVSEPTNKTQDYNSIQYHLNVKKVATELVIIPVRYNDKTKEFSLKLHDSKDSLSISITPFTQFPEILSYLKMNNPVYRLLAPEVLTANHLEEVLSTIFDLSFRPETLKAYLMTQGTLLFPALKIKYRLKQMLNIQFIDSYQIITTPKSRFIRITQGKLAHILSLSPPYLKFTYQLRGKEKYLATEFPQFFLSKLLPSRKDKLQQTENILSYENSIDPFFYLDLALDENLTKQTNDYFQHYLRELDNRISQDPTLVTEDFSTSMERFKKLHTSLCPTCEIGKKGLKEDLKKPNNKRDSDKTIKRKSRSKSSKRRK